MTHAVQSMTGFGTAAFEMAGASYSVTVRSVNHKHLNTRFALPPELSSVEPKATGLLRERLGRGSVQVTVRLEAAGQREPEVLVNRAGANKLMASLEELAVSIGARTPDLETILKLGDFVELRPAPIDDEELGRAFLDALDAALGEVIAMRTGEGAALAEDLVGRLDALERSLDEVEAASPQVRDAYEERLRERISQAAERHGVDVDEGRLVTELTLFADRIDVTEETVRARTHARSFRDLLAGGSEPLMGKRLDFLSQELNREFNTIGSKCRDAGMAGSVVDAKVELERIREQVQNIA